MSLLRLIYTFKQYSVFNFYRFQKIRQLNHMKKGSVKKFIKKLSQIIDNPQYSSWISWNTDGTRIIINEPQIFEDKVIPKHFRLKKLSSFVRQLHLYDFHKIKARDFSLIFINSNFIKDDPEAMANIRRKRLTKAQELQMQKSKNDKNPSQTITNQYQSEREQQSVVQKSVAQVAKAEQVFEQNLDLFLDKPLYNNDFFDEEWWQ